MNTVLVVGSPDYYRRTFSDNLKSRLQLIYVNHRGFSHGDEDPSTITLETLADDIEAARKSLNLDNFTILGHSGHAYMALEYAKKYPDHVNGVVMLGASPDLSPESHAKAEANWQLNASEERKEAFAKSIERMPDAMIGQMPEEKQFIANYLRMTPRIWYDFTFDASTLWESVYVNKPVFDHVWGNLFANINIAKGLESFDLPVFIGLGRHDYILPPPSDWDRILPLFQNVEMHIFEKSGHTPQFEEPELFDAILLNWLRVNITFGHRVGDIDPSAAQ